MLAFIFGLVVGLFTGMLIVCLLVGPRIAELESTVYGLREALVFYGVGGDMDENQDEVVFKN